MPYKDIEKQREYQRKWKATRGRKPTTEEKRAYNEAYKTKHPEKVSAQRLVQYRVKTHAWPKAEFFLCAECNDKATHYHHEHYEQPTSVEPLCQKCHSKRHHTK